MVRAFQSAQLAGPRHPHAIRPAAWTYMPSPPIPPLMASPQVFPSNGPSCTCSYVNQKTRKSRGDRHIKWTLRENYIFTKTFNAPQTQSLERLGRPYTVMAASSVSSRLFCALGRSHAHGARVGRSPTARGELPVRVTKGTRASSAALRRIYDAGDVQFPYLVVAMTSAPARQPTQ